MAEKEDYLDTQNFWGDHRLIPYEVFKRGTQMKCIYCGDFADTREHCPSRTFLQEPRPCDLPVLPTCKKCNNSFSADELYMKTFIEHMKAAWLGDKADVKDKLKKNLEVIKAQEKVNEILKTGKIEFDNKIGHVLEKLAKCHCVYELTENYYRHEWELKDISYTFRSCVEENVWDSIGRVECIADCILPEIGSRCFRNIRVLEVVMENIENYNRETRQQLILVWNIVQEGNYEYVAYLNRHREMIVKIIIMDFLYAEIIYARCRNNDLKMNF